MRKLARKYHTNHVSIYEYLSNQGIKRIEKVVDKKFLEHLLKKHDKKTVCDILGFKSITTLYEYINKFDLQVVNPKHIEILKVYDQTLNYSKTATICNVEIATVRKIVRANDNKGGTENGTRKKQ
ncbi:MAG: hypothetical protein AB7E61_07155 [Acholeplasmataceae bacterium]